MFSSGLTQGIFDNFLREFELNRTELIDTPFLYVDRAFPEYRLLTSITQSKNNDHELYAYSICSEGHVEILSTEIL